MWAGSPNDPLFFSEHIIQWFERWLECHHQASYIIANYFPPHLLVMVHRIVHVVPFSPLYTHEDMFNCSINFVHM